MRDEHLVPGGSLYDLGSGSLRSALDAALSSPSGVGVAVDADGRVAGAVSADDVLAVLDDARRDGDHGRGLRGARPWSGSWIPRNSDLILSLLGEHLVLSLIPVLVGLVLAVPLGWLANRNPAARAVLIPTAGLLYTIPSLALFIVLPGILGTQILDPINVIVALTIYTVALLVRSIADALAAVPGDGGGRGHRDGLPPGAGGSSRSSCRCRCRC